MVTAEGRAESRMEGLLMSLMHACPRTAGDRDNHPESASRLVRNSDLRFRWLRVDRFDCQPHVILHELMHPCADPSCTGSEVVVTIRASGLAPGGAGPALIAADSNREPYRDEMVSRCSARPPRADHRTAVPALRRTHRLTIRRDSRRRHPCVLALGAAYELVSLGDLADGLIR